MSEYPQIRPRRLRQNGAVRRFARETRLQAGDFILPLFIREGISEPVPIPTLPGVFQETVESVEGAVQRAVDGGISTFILFGIPATKSEDGHEAWAEDGIVQQGIRRLVAAFGQDIVVMADCCLDEFTSHGHCGILRDGEVDNDATLPLYGMVAQSQAAAGATFIAPSGMMDGQVAAIRAALDADGACQTGIVSYAAKGASVMYGPFRDAAQSTPAFGDRRGYQMPVSNAREAMREIDLDIAEGADAIIVKPALTSLDIIYRAHERTLVPTIAYSVSGEHAMLHAGAGAAAFDRRRAVLEVLSCIRRAGADRIITYSAVEAAAWLAQEGGEE